MEPELRTSDTDLQTCGWKDCKLPRIHEGRCDILSPIFITYTNWKNNRRKRKVSPTGRVEHTTSVWHKVPQWLFEVIDHEDGKQKLFTLKDVDVVDRSMLQTTISMRWNRA